MKNNFILFVSALSILIVSITVMTLSSCNTEPPIPPSSDTTVSESASDTSPESTVDSPTDTIAPETENKNFPPYTPSDPTAPYNDTFNACADLLTYFQEYSIMEYRKYNVEIKNTGEKAKLQSLHKTDLLHKTYGIKYLLLVNEIEGQPQKSEISFIKKNEWALLDAESYFYPEHPTAPGMVRIAYKFDGAKNINTGENNLLDKNISISFDLPNFLLRSGNVENTGSFVFWNDNEQMYSTAFTINTLYEVNEDYIMGDTVYYDCIKGPESNKNITPIKKGKTSTGFDFVAYGLNGGSEYTCFIRINANYIVKIVLKTRFNETKAYTDQIVDSVRLKYE